jgi:hypothetical protein
MNTPLSTQVLGRLRRGRHCGKSRRVESKPSTTRERRMRTKVARIIICESVSFMRSDTLNQKDDRVQKEMEDAMPELFCVLNTLGGPMAICCLGVWRDAVTDDPQAWV